MRFHCPSLPGQAVTRENSICAFTQKVRNFARMMTARGHEVMVYGEEEYDHPGEHIGCWPTTRPAPAFDPGEWELYNGLAAMAIQERWQDGDFLCVIGGTAQKAVADVLKVPAVEYGIGYGGIFAPFKAFESYAWMHATYGAYKGNTDADGEFFDAVIPAAFDVNEAPFVAHKRDYVAYCGRMTARKGVQVASEAAQTAGVELRMAGAGEAIPEYGDWLGPLGPDDRWDLISNAQALFVPTLYLEPFAQVHVEAMLCGTPVIATDWGVFTETLVPGVNGFRCRMLWQFAQSIELARRLDPQLIREMAVARFCYDAVAPQFEEFFTRVAEVRDGAGWYADAPKRDCGCPVETFSELEMEQAARQARELVNLGGADGQ